MPESCHDHKAPVSGCWMLVSGYWMLDAGYWILITEN
jgi:hypothetical protein